MAKVWKVTAEKKKLERMIENIWSERKEENQEKVISVKPEGRKKWSTIAIKLEKLDLAVMRTVVPWWNLFLGVGVQKTDCYGSRREWRERRRS